MGRKNIQTNALGGGSAAPKTRHKKRLTRKRKRTYIITSIVLLILVINVFNIVRTQIAEMRREQAMNNFGDIDNSTDTGDVNEIYDEELPFSIHVIDAGLGDAILVKSGDLDILIDSGSIEKRNDVIQYLREYVTDRTIEYIINTNPELGKTSNIQTIIEKFNVEKIYLADSGEPETDEHALFLETRKIAKEKDILQNVENGNISLGHGINLAITPISIKNGDKNYITTISKDNYTLFFPGNASDSDLTNLISILQPVDFMIYPNHGAELLSEEVYTVLEPGLIIISTNDPEVNTYKYPVPEVIDNYKSSDSCHYTYLEGTIIVESQNDYLSVLPKEEETKEDDNIGQDSLSEVSLNNDNNDDEVIDDVDNPGSIETDEAEFGSILTIDELEDDEEIYIPEEEKYLETISEYQEEEQTKIEEDD